MDDTLIQFGASAREPQERTLVCPECSRRSSGESVFCPYDGERLVLAVEDGTRGQTPIGTVVDGRYEIQGVLGEGGMGTVYRVRHVTLERSFALKAMRHDLASDAEVATRFIQEAKAAAAVSHPAVVQITDFGTLPTGEPYFVMELLEGHSLGRLLRDGGPLPPARALGIIRQVAEGLGAAHEVGVVHRDLKPDNVHVGPRDQVAVLDFGLAKVVGGSKLTRAGLVFGTPHYMSPEQAGGESVDHRSDIYALGVLAFQIITGRLPFEADTYMGVMTQHMHTAPPRPSDLVRKPVDWGGLEEVILRCLAKRPAERFQTMADLVVALDGVLGGLEGAPKATPLPRSALEGRTPVPPSLPASRRWGWAPFVAAAGLVAAMVLVLALMRFRGRSPQAEAPVPPPSVSVGVAAQVPPASSSRSSVRRPLPAPQEPHPVPQRPKSRPAPASVPVPGPSRAPSTRSVPGEGDIVDPWEKRR